MNGCYVRVRICACACAILHRIWTSAAHIPSEFHKDPRNTQTSRVKLAIAPGFEVNHIPRGNFVWPPASNWLFFDVHDDFVFWPRVHFPALRCGTRKRRNCTPRCNCRFPPDAMAPALGAQIREIYQTKGQFCVELGPTSRMEGQCVFVCFERLLVGCVRSI